MAHAVREISFAHRVAALEHVFLSPPMIYSNGFVKSGKVLSFRGVTICRVLKVGNSVAPSVLQGVEAAEGPQLHIPRHSIPRYSWTTHGHGKIEDVITARNGLL